MLGNVFPISRTDNLTTSIVMVSLIRKLIPNKETRLFFAGMIVIAPMQVARGLQWEM
jgi:hypothetical protein